MAEKKKEILICLLTGWSSILIFCIIAGVQNMDLSIPFTYSGDVSGLLINIKTMLRNEKWWNFDALAAPFHTNMWRQLMDAYIPNAIIFATAKLTNSVGYGINLYYILSYGLSGMCAYYMLRKSGIVQPYSIVGGILYALIPGHLIRNQGHLYIGSCFPIPLVIITAMHLYKGNMCKLEFITKKILTPKELLNSNSHEQTLGLIFFTFVSLCSLYYGVFSLMLLTFCAVYCSVTQKQLRHIYYYFQYVFILIVCIIFMYTPQILTNYFDPYIEKVNITTRLMGDVELYAGKLTQYILPVSGHRISVLAKLRHLYDTSFPLVNENGMASLGLIMSSGLVIGILSCFFSKEKIFFQFEMLGKFELFMFFASTVGGLGAIVGILDYNIRCYNRFSFLIGAVGIIISMKLLQEFNFWIINKINGKHIQTIASYCICLVIVVIGIFDQTTTSMAYSRDYGENLRNVYNNDLNFVKNIESYEGENANILIFPIMNAQQSATAITQDGIHTGYNEQILFIHSETSNWSTGSKAGESGERWLNWLETFDEKAQVEIAAIVGFSGIAIYYGGFEQDKLNIILTELNELLGKPTILNDNGTWAYYSISKVRDELLSDYTENELLELKNKYLYNYKYLPQLYDYSNLSTTSEYIEDNKIVLTKGTWQYGPYNSFDAGVYMVEIYGENLKSAEIDCFANGSSFDIDIINYYENYIKYYVRFDKNYDAVEFRAFNATDSEIIVEKIEVNKLKNDM